eukprot:5878945-Amphidinium_carterae.1
MPGSPCSGQGIPKSDGPIVVNGTHQKICLSRGPLPGCEAAPGCGPRPGGHTVWVRDTDRQPLCTQT